jgi:hypothetical protein
MILPEPWTQVDSFVVLGLSAVMLVLALPNPIICSLISGRYPSYPHTSIHFSTHGFISDHPSRPAVANMNMNTTASSFLESRSRIGLHISHQSSVAPRPVLQYLSFQNIFPHFISSSRQPLLGRPIGYRKRAKLTKTSRKNILLLRALTNR